MFRGNISDLRSRTLLSLMAVLAITSAFAGRAASGQECRWEGSGPFCDGQCEAGWTYTGQRTQDGCWTGSKRFCCRRDKSEVCRGSVDAATTGCKFPLVK